MSTNAARRPLAELHQVSPVVKAMAEEGVDTWAIVKDHVAAAAPKGVTMEVLDAVKTYVETGETEPFMRIALDPERDSSIRSALAWLGVEHLFDTFCMPREAADRFAASLARVTATFAKAVHRSHPLIWDTKMTDLHKRSAVFIDHSRAALERLPEFSAAALAAEVVFDIDAMEDAAVMRVPGKPAGAPRVHWDHLYRETTADRPWLPNDLPWLSRSSSDGPRRGLVMAGGALERLAVGQEWREIADIDLFIVDEAPPLKEEWPVPADMSDIIIQALRALAARAKSLCINVRYGVVDITASFTDRVVKVQIIRRIYASAAHVVAGFDIDSCRLAFDGASLKAHPTALRAWSNGWNLFDAYTLSTSALHRYTKKALLGFGALVLGVPKRELALRRFVLSRLKHVPEHAITIDTLIWHLQHAGKRGSPPVPPPGLASSDYLTDDHGDRKMWLVRNTPSADVDLELDNIWYHYCSTTGRFMWMKFQYAVASSRWGFTGSFHPVYDDIYARSIDVDDLDAEINRAACAAV